MPTCPAGHDSAEVDFCDVCGLAMDHPPPVAASATPPPPAEPDVVPDSPCAACGATLTGRFCEQCGHDSLTQPPVLREPYAPVARDVSSARAWTATVSADRAHYDSVMADSPDADITFPPFCPDRHFPLQGKQVSIGRQSRRRGIDPDIDLTGPPEDPGISHLHALLVAQDDGSWAIVDLDSANGVTVNAEPTPLRPNTPRVLADGDRVHLGAWTRITLRAT